MEICTSSKLTHYWVFYYPCTTDIWEVQLYNYSGTSHMRSPEYFITAVLHISERGPSTPVLLMRSHEYFIIIVLLISKRPEYIITPVLLIWEASSISLQFYYLYLRGPGHHYCITTHMRRLEYFMTAILLLFERHEYIIITILLIWEVPSTVLH